MTDFFNTIGCFLPLAKGRNRPDAGNINSPLSSAPERSHARLDERSFVNLRSLRARRTLGYKRNRSTPAHAARANSEGLGRGDEKLITGGVAERIAGHVSAKMI